MLTLTSLRVHYNASVEEKFSCAKMAENGLCQWVTVGLFLIGSKPTCINYLSNLLEAFCMFSYIQMLLIVCAMREAVSAKQSHIVMEAAERSVADDDTVAAAGVVFEDEERLAVARQIFGGRTGYNG